MYVAINLLSLMSANIMAQDLAAMSDEEIMNMKDADRLAVENSLEVELANADEGAGVDLKQLGGWDYCKHDKCGEGEGDCDKNSECMPGLVCGLNNCHPSKGFHALTDCCEKLKMFHFDYCRYHDCGLGEGDCDCHAQCGPGLKCGVNNCRKMHPEIVSQQVNTDADCCMRCSTVRVGASWRRVKVEPEYWGTDQVIAGTERTLVRPPPALQGAAVYSLKALTTDDSIKIECCKYRSELCEFFISVYQCKPCSDGLNGGLPEYLSSAGWEAGSCSPRFMIPGDTPKTHGFTTFHRTLSPGETEVIPISTYAPHVVVYERTGPLSSPWCVRPTGPSPPNTPCECIPLK